MIDSFHCSGKSSLFGRDLITLRISEQILLPPTLMNYAGCFPVPGDLCRFTFSVAISNSKALDSGTSDSAVCVFVSLT
jgi:hypothetical protein